MTANPDDTMAALADSSVTVLRWPPRRPNCRRAVRRSPVRRTHPCRARTGRGREGGGDFRPAVVIGADVRFDDLVATDGMSLLDLDPYGLVVVDTDDTSGARRRAGGGARRVPGRRAGGQATADGSAGERGGRTVARQPHHAGRRGDVRCAWLQPSEPAGLLRPPASTACANPDQPPHLLAVPGLG